MSIDAGELDGLVGDLQRRVREVRREASTVVRRTAYAIVATSQQLVPVDTGTTKSSIHASAPSGGPLAGFSLEAHIGPTTDYAEYLEYGTSRRAPQPFMGPAADRHTPEFVEGLADVVGRLGNR